MLRGEELRVPGKAPSWRRWSWRRRRRRGGGGGGGFEFEGLYNGERGGRGGGWGEGEGRGVLGRRVDLGNYSSGEPVVLGGSGPGEGQGLERVRAGQAQYLSRCLNQVCTKIINRQCFHM